MKMRLPLCAYFFLAKCSMAHSRKLFCFTPAGAENILNYFKLKKKCFHFYLLYLYLHNLYFLPKKNITNVVFIGIDKKYYFRKKFRILKPSAAGRSRVERNTAMSEAPML